MKTWHTSRVRRMSCPRVKVLPRRGSRAARHSPRTFSVELLPAGGCGSTMPHRYCRLGADRRRRN